MRSNNWARGIGVSLLFLPIALAQQPSYHITPLHPIEQLREAALKAQPLHEQGDFLSTDLVELSKIDPDLKLDIRYATANNFIGVPVYTQARAFLQRPAAEAVLRASLKRWDGRAVRAPGGR